MSVLNGIEPKEVFCFFEEICQIPHESHDMQRISDYCVNFAKERGLCVQQDERKNVVIWKPGSAGYEQCDPVILQGHLDMVCEKTLESSHDFNEDPLQLYVEDGYVKAKDTTLGADDGIAVAMMLALLDSKDISHPTLEAVFTVDEETGMGGASAIDFSILKGRRMINLDSEEEGIFTVGCAGGFRYEACIPVTRKKQTGLQMQLTIRGLVGGHSGVDIHKQCGNANKMMGRLCTHIAEQIPIQLINICGGGKDNVIPGYSEANILLQASDREGVHKLAEEMLHVWKEEFMGQEPGLELLLTFSDIQEVDVCDVESSRRVLSYLVAVPDGVQGMHRELNHLVESSINLGVMETESDVVKLQHLVRSCVESRKEQMKEQLGICVALVSGTGKVMNEYASWPYQKDSALMARMIKVYEKINGEAPMISVIHAGLECGLFLEKCKNLECVSIGPNMKDIHTVAERLDIASTERVWTYLKELLKDMNH